jgi:mono/diheme cytochrome c family protein
MLLRVEICSMGIESELARAISSTAVVSGGAPERRIALESARADGVPPQPERRKGLVLLSLPIVLFVLGWAVLPLLFIRLARPNSEVAPGGAPLAAATANGAALYSQHCAYCHGERGDGAGPTAVALFPKPRNFGEAKFRLKTTTSGTPTDEDLFETLRRGIPGSAMPSFAHLSEEELRALIAHVRLLTRTGIYDRVRHKAVDDGDDYLAGVSKRVDSLSQVGAVIDIPTYFPAATPDSLANGRELYQKNCAACHGPQGHGDGPQVATMKNDDGWPTRPRDFTSGVFKGGAEPAKLYARIVVGMPGTPMPACSHLKPAELGDLINYVRSLCGPAPHTPGQTVSR